MKRIHKISLVFASICYVSSLPAAELLVEVQDLQGKLIKDAIVYLEPATPASPSTSAKAEVIQKGKRFNPMVTVVQTGTSVNFPNQDSVRHHVYSFSPAKKFELKLYSGVPANPVIFDKAGTVALGCNIHDNMIGFIYIVDTPYFAKTDQVGLAKLTDLPNGRYQLKVWHYALQKENTPVEQAIEVKEATKKLGIKLDINQHGLVQN